MSRPNPFVVRWAGLLAAFALFLAIAAIDRGAFAQATSSQPAQPPPAPLTTQGGSTLRSRSLSYQEPKKQPTPKRTIKAYVVALDQPYMWNRLGASQPNAMVYALARDVVPTDYDPSINPKTGMKETDKTFPPPPFSTFKPGCVRLREDRRPRPLVLRANEGDLLEVHFTNLLATAPPPIPNGQNNTSTETRYAGFHVMGLELYKDGGIGNDSSWVGTNPPVTPTSTQPGYVAPLAQNGGEPGSVCAPGATKVYKYYAKAEGTYLVHSFSADSPGANQISQLQSGLFGVVNVQPEGAEYYRSQVLADDLGKATYYIWEKDLQPWLARSRNLVLSTPNIAERRQQARLNIIHLPKQSGVYYLDEAKQTDTNMEIALQLDAAGNPDEAEIDGVKYPVYILATVVPARENQRQLRTLKTTSVVLQTRKGDPPGMLRLSLASGQQLVNYVSIYPREANYLSGQPIPFITPVLSMLAPAPDPIQFPHTNTFELVNGDLTAVITGPGHDRWPYSTNGPLFNENPSSPDRRQPYREFTIVYHYNFQSVAAFPQLASTGQGNYANMGGDFFAINYGCAGIGAEILANRLGVGPMGRKDAVDLKFEEFFLSSWSCGDPAIVVDVPANTPNEAVTIDGGLKIKQVFSVPSSAALIGELDGGTLPPSFVTQFKDQKPPIIIPAGTKPATVTKGARWTVADSGGNIYTIMLGDCNGTATLAVAFPAPPPQQPLAKKKATKAFYPDDPSNVYHSYMRDHVKFRVLNASEGITHVHHQHAHQWLHSPNSDNGQYLDSQTVVAGSGYTMEIVHGGSGNLNYTVGDSIFHCHFYPHFAEGMWSLWRVHDVFEAGTKLDEKGIPDTKDRWNRAYPDGEIEAGTPIPALVPMPSLAMAPYPARVRLEAEGRRVEVEARNQAEIDELRSEHPDDPGQWPEPNYAKSPGYPFFIPGISGHRAPHPPLDYAWKEDDHGNPIYDPKTGKKVYLDGGLPRHVVLDGDVVRNYFTKWDFTKDFVVVGDKPPYKAKAGGLVAYELPQEGTALEQTAMRTHSTRARRSYLPNGDPGNFILNGLPAVPGAPYAPPGVRGDGESNVNIRRYKAAILQIDTVFNKKGWHFPQQRMLTLWGDVAPTVTGVRPPQPFFFRSNTDDTIEYWHTNLVPNYYEMDDFQVRTPTDVLGQHIHLVKFDVTSSDGAGNGFNYEDGTFSPQEVRERIAAIMAKGGIYQFDDRAPFETKFQTPLAVKSVAEEYPLPGHPGKSLFGQPPPFQNWDGAQTTVQRFDTDPTLNNDGLDRTVRSVFTHDHFSPSTHQQAGYYAALLVEPDNSIWKFPVITADANGKSTVKYEQGGSRFDGGPTSWQANIVTVDPAQSYREFAFEFQDMQLAYLAGSTPKLQTPSQLLPPQPLFPFTQAAQNAVLNELTLTLGQPIPEVNGGKIVRDLLESNGIILSEDAVINAGNAPNTFVITDPQTKTPEGFDTTYPITTIGGVLNLFTPNMNPGWSDPLFAVASPGGNSPTPNPQLISFGTMGTYSVNYRNEPLPLRVAPVARAPGVTNPPDSTDLAFAYASIKRGDPDLNVQPVSFAMPLSLKPLFAARQLVPPIIQAFADGGVTLTNTPALKAEILVDTVFGNGWLVFNPDPSGTGSTTYAVRDPGPPLPPNLYVLTRTPASPRYTLNDNLKPLFVAGNLVQQIITAFANVGVTLTNTPTSKAEIIDDPVTKGWLVINPNPGGTGSTLYTVRELGPPSFPLALYVFTQSTGVFPPPVVPLSADPKDGGVAGLDPFTPMMRAYVNDRIQVRALAGAHMNEHSFSIHGVNFRFEPSYTNSGFLSTHAISLSEHFEMEFTMPARSADQKNDFADYLYAPSANGQGQTSGSWGILRSFDGAKGDLGKEGSSVYLEPLDKDHPKYTAPATIDFADRFKKAKNTQEYTVIATTAQQILPSGTLYYNTRGQATHNFPFQATGGAQTKLENPYALVYVDANDLDNPTDPSTAKLKSDMRIEPLILRANAGDWIKITLINQFLTSAKTFNGGTKISSFPAGNPFIKLSQTQVGAPSYVLNTSTLAGLHPQLVAYDVTTGDGVNVGFNPTQTVDPTNNPSSTFYWYAGNLSFDENNNLVETPVEFGSVNLAPADPLIQHRKGLIGALVIEPYGSSWPKAHNDLKSAPEYQYIYDSAGNVTSVNPSSTKTRAIATVTKSGVTLFDELVLAMQTDAYMYEQAPKGVKPPANPPVLVYTNAPALNYRSEPLTYRYAAASSVSAPAAAPAGTAARLSNALVTPDLATGITFTPTMADPQTPILTTKAGTPVRVRWMCPAGAGSDSAGSSQVLAVHGHVFQEEPYINDSKELGFNPLSQWMGGRFVLPGQTVDMLFASAGGSFEVPGDYFYGTFIGQTAGTAPAIAPKVSLPGPSQALWGLLRVQ